MKKFLLLACLLVGCGSRTDSTDHYVDANTVNMSIYAGKVVKSVTYHDDQGPSGDLLIVHFTDGTNLTVYAYKYQMKIYL